VENKRLLDKDLPMPHRDGVDEAGSCHFYELTLEEHLKDLVGRLLIDWGPGDRSWIQRADEQDKQITELPTAFKEADFPGFLNFIQPLSRIEGLPPGWVTALKNSKGIYLLTCPKTKEQYVGKADGKDGFGVAGKNTSALGTAETWLSRAATRATTKCLSWRLRERLQERMTLPAWKCSGSRNCKAGKWGSIGID
jgi:hypothetical protein